jgi:peroxiredoxin Q/BCP
MAVMTIGAPAPDFSLPAHTGETVCLSQFRGKQAVVVFFYPADETPICTKEACAFRDAHAVFAAAGATVLGISGDSLESHAAFASRHQLPYPLLADLGDRVRLAWEVPKTLGLFPGRVTYIIDREGIIRHLYNSQLAAQGHVDVALRIIRDLEKPGESR